MILMGVVGLRPDEADLNGRLPGWDSGLLPGKRWMGTRAGVPALHCLCFLRPGSFDIAREADRFQRVDEVPPDVRLPPA